ncbi:bifunctional preprotein translocase subunit SecD/SecF [Slackia heliotrinireducens]|uniref:Multifunctional fusion protein n=1 Tax=Slackia heliotrinireducens (strain ATCC 29202 / DSM 20476 / NCTC 11029 / RHS 1) TaxID=471855 RepID=C7N4E3_SLAHD|nr:protein translocase subunit SecDF [Slackia heliotrinireducens]ACV21778.1 protein-export membrane protein SecF/protein-export membrane protein SecD [Slackia heliotrinireducens DSM 20476]VEG99453.1 bifunctional preprotein translocase subunit SecD/SecF [Slackia heliotrinireducens]
MSETSSKAKRRSGGNVDRRNIWLVVVTAVLVIASIAMFMPPQERINQALDLQGGLSVVLSAESNDGSEVTAEQMETSRSIIESRVNLLGASEAVVQLQGDNQILVQIPGLSDTEEALETIGKTGKLEFARLDSFTDQDVVNAIQTGAYLSQETVTDEAGNVFVTGEGTPSLEVEPGTYEPIVTGENINRVTVGRESETSQFYAVDLNLDSEGTKAFAEASADLVEDHGQIVIILDGVVQSAPAVQSEIPDGNVAITGNYSLAEAQSLVTVLESGSLPVSFEYQTAQTVGPTLGQGALRSGVIVALIGLLLVMLYLLFFYKGLGFITAAAMAVFACLYLGILALLSHFNLFSLSLAGIAGVVLTIGMAADSSILTLERFREEIRLGRSVRAASITGVRHGIMTSIDADLVTLVSALALFFLAAASVKGFGLTLALGIFCDILMMLLFKAPLIRLLAPKAIAKNPGFWGVKDCEEAAPYFTDEKEAPAGGKIPGRFIKHDFNILGWRKVTLTAAVVAVVLVLAILGIRGINFGIEFVGGTSVAFHNTGDVTIEQLRDAFDEAGETDAVIQTTETDGEPGFLVRTTTTSAEDANVAAKAVADTFGWETDSFEVTTIGPDWGTSVIKSSVIAFLVSLILIIIYISIRFRDYKMGVTAIVALLHDLILVFGIYALIGREVTPNTIAAVLTILGYSLYDTVVVFRSIDDNMKGDSIKCTFMSMANHSLNQVLIRSLNTSITSLIPVLFMLLFGAETLKDFALAMTIGLVSGCYSSLAIATPLYAIWKTREPEFARLVKKFGDTVQLFTLNHLPGELRVAGAAATDAAVVDVGADAKGGKGNGAHKSKSQPQQKQRYRRKDK